MRNRWMLGGLIALGLGASLANAEVMQFGDRNLLGTGTYSSDPTAGATLEGLAPGAVSEATNVYPHTYPFQPAPGAFPGTDQIYTSGPPTEPHDGYSASPGSVPGPQVLTMDYGSLVPAGQKVGALTVGIAADDFQQPEFHQPFVATINGVVNDAISQELNTMQLGGPKVHFFTAGVDPSLLSPSNVLTLSIDRGGPGSDGWAVDFATIGVTPVPEPSTFAIVLLGLGALGLRRRSATI